VREDADETREVKRQSASRNISILIVECQNWTAGDHAHEWTLCGCLPFSWTAIQIRRQVHHFHSWSAERLAFNPSFLHGIPNYMQMESLGTRHGQFWH
jgi:hypothetical protein